MKRFRACQLVMSICLAGVLSAFVFPAPATAATCTRWVAMLVSVQGSVKAQRMGEERPLPANLNDTFCPGDKIRVEEGGRAVLLLSNETLLRLDQNTTIRFYEPERERNFLLDLLEGAAYFISRTPKGFKCTTPYMNAGVEGTEFLLAVAGGRTLLSTFEGTVLAENDHGALRLAGGQSAVAEEGKPPVVRIDARPRDAVQWTLYYPPILPPGPAGLPPGFPESWQSRVSRLLSVGRVDEAKLEIDDVLTRTPGDGSALALQSVIAVAQNEKGIALDLARKAVAADPGYALAWIALSYAQQAGFDIAGARASVEEAVRLDPGNALAWARLAELWMSSGYLDKALDAANKAAGLDPGLARTQTVLGFAHLAQIKIKTSKEAFEKAIILDSADPLPRLGLGLARIREGDLTGGRSEIEIAASLAPNNSLVRSYLGKAYYEEKRDKPASSQLGMAKELDPNDPTPWFYDAIRKQTVNRPVEALHDMQKSISLNDDRAVYRSRLLLDEDLAARDASMGRIYSDLGFQQLALVEGWKSVNTDPANWSAHRLLADSYSILPRHEIARVSELLQSQLLQPINLLPVQPQLAQSNLQILSAAGPANPSFNEFNPLFIRNQIALQASGVAGSQNTFGEELVVSGIQDRVSYSIGQSYFSTDGFRENNGQRLGVVDAYVQASLSHWTSVQAEFRASNVDQGDRSLNFFPDDFLQGLRISSDWRSGRVGFRHAFGPGSDVIGYITYQRVDSDGHLEVPPTLVADTGQEEKSFGGEIQFLARSGRGSLVGGGGYFATDQHGDQTFIISLPPPIPSPPPIQFLMEENVRHTNLYLYAYVRYPQSLTWTIGASADFFTGRDGFSDPFAGPTGVVDENKFNPKAGVIWNPLPDTMIRAAAFRVLRRTLLTSQQTLEPTQVAGFNQFFDDTAGTSAWNYGVAVDQKFSPKVYAGMEYVWRNLEVPFQSTFFPPPPAAPVTTIQQADWREQQGRAYINWTLDDRFALSAEYQYEEIKRGQEISVLFDQVKTHRVPLRAAFFHPCGFFARLNGTWYRQDGSFNLQNSPSDVFVQGSDSFWLVNASIGYRLPGRYGILSLEGTNLFDEAFRYQDTDPASPTLQPKRAVFFKATFAL